MAAILETRLAERLQETILKKTILQNTDKNNEDTELKRSILQKTQMLVHQLLESLQPQSNMMIYLDNLKASLNPMGLNYTAQEGDNETDQVCACT